MLYRLLLLLALPLLLNSCATITARKTYNAKVFADVANAKATINNSTYTLPAWVKLPRSKEDLEVQLVTDSIQKDFTLKPGPAPRFFFGNLLFIQAAPVAYGVDFTNQKRFYYGKFIRLSASDTATLLRPQPIRGLRNYFKRVYPTRKGEVRLTPFIPYGNFFFMQPEGMGYKSRGGFFGIGLGAEYHYRDNKFAKAQAASLIDFSLPILVPLDTDDDDYSRFSTSYFDVTDNFVLRRFTVGYGINYSLNTWDHHSDSLYGLPDMHLKSRAFGLTANAYYQFARYFFIGVNYNSSILNVHPQTELLYQHAISIQFMGKIKIF